MKRNLEDRLNAIIHGAEIDKIVLNGFSDGMNGVTFNPVICLENGCTIQFSVVETEIGEYGIVPTIFQNGKKLT
jgi:hypothetical protein